MAQNINLNSIAWCDLVFEGKNKEYGAYEMRQAASNRHISAFVITFVALALLILGPALLEKTGITSSRLEGTTEANVISVIETIDKEETPIDIPESKPLPPPPEDIRKALAHNPPTIVENSTNTEGQEMLSVDELNKDKSFMISSKTFLEGSTKGIDPGDILGEIGGTPGGTGVKDEGPVLIPDVPAQFLGGEVELMRFLRDKIKYPVVAAEAGIEGKTIIRFVVSKDGSISNVEVLRGADPSLDKEAVRVVKSMPPWVPAMKDGKKVNAYFTLPVTFKLSK